MERRAYYIAPCEWCFVNTARSLELTFFYRKYVSATGKSFVTLCVPRVRLRKPWTKITSSWHIMHVQSCICSVISCFCTRKELFYFVCTSHKAEKTVDKNALQREPPHVQYTYITSIATLCTCRLCTCICVLALSGPCEC